MPARALVAVSAALASLLLFACGDGGEGKTKQAGTPQQRLAAALDPCAEGGDAFAHSVCANRTLAGIDGQIRETLVAEAAEVSAAGAEMLARNQQRWRTAQRIECGILEPDAQPDAEQLACLEGGFRSRAADAQNAVQAIGGYTFQRMELVDANPVTIEVAAASGLGEEAPAAIIRDIRFPRIDGEQTPEIQRFNALVAQQPQFGLEDATNEVVDYHIAYAGAEIISVRFDMSSDTLGAAHPSNSIKAVTVLMHTGQQLRETDVFRADTRWQDFIAARAVRELGRQFREYDFNPPERDVRESATKPHLWIVGESGLTLLFPPLSFGGSHADGDAQVRISWADLRPYLNPEAPAPINAVAQNSAENRAGR